MSAPSHFAAAGGVSHPDCGGTTASMELSVVNHLTLDGVMQAPGHPDEDRRGGFEHGGWAVESGGDPQLLEAIGRRVGGPEAKLLLGRVAYEGMLSGWNERGGPFKDALNSMPKHVVSGSADTQLEWPNSTLIHGDVPAAVAELKRGDAQRLVTMGSGQLIRSLIPHGLIDELLLMVHPLVLGTGLRMFEQPGAYAEFELVESFVTDGGVIVGTYRPR
jgi:dihydrofolate reductase